MHSAQRGLYLESSRDVKIKNSKTPYFKPYLRISKKKIPFQITAGFAAKIYGSDRPLYDIDLDVPEKDIKDLAEDVKKFIVKGPYHRKSKHFDLILLTLNYKGQPIDLGGAYDVKIKDKRSSKWINYPTDFSIARKHNIFEMRLPVVTKEELISYKSMVARPTDLDDVRQIS